MGDGEFLKPGLSAPNGVLQAINTHHGKENEPEVWGNDMERIRISPVQNMKGVEWGLFPNNIYNKLDLKVKVLSLSEIVNNLLRTQEVAPWWHGEWGVRLDKERR